MLPRKNSMLLIAAVVAALGLGAMARSAQAQCYYYAPAPVYFAPAPAYVAPAPAYYAAPVPVVYSAPVYYPAYTCRPSGFGFSFGYWGGGHHGHRYYGHHGRGFGFSFGYRGCR